jgi:hypothetical protein
MKRSFALIASSNIGLHFSAMNRTPLETCPNQGEYFTGVQHSVHRECDARGCLPSLKAQTDTEAAPEATCNGTKGAREVDHDSDLQAQVAL